MDSFVWDEYFLTGLASIDEQHHRLVDLINSFGDRLSDGTLTLEAFEQLIKELNDYAIYHFAEEETLMSTVGVDQRHIDSHHSVHRRFLREVNLLAAEIHTPTSQEAEDLLGFLMNWLAFHILGEDKNMGRQIKAIEAGEDPVAAYQHYEQRRDDSKEPLVRALQYLFNQMSERNHQLHDLNEHLEELVNERTAALKAANEQLQEIAFIDALTGLPNRRSIMNHLQEQWRQGGDLACLMIDADYFKRVNDDYGHDQGDRVLVELASCLKDSMRSDELVGRLGGDEFLIVCRADLAGARQLATKISAVVNDMSICQDDGKEIWHGSVSIGYATRSSDMLEPGNLIGAADRSVYLAKEAGRNCCRSVDEATLL